MNNAVLFCLFTCRPLASCLWHTWRKSFPQWSACQGMYGYQSQWTAVCCTSSHADHGYRSGMGTSLSGYFGMMSFFSFAKQKLNIVLHFMRASAVQCAWKDQARGLFGVSTPKGFRSSFKPCLSAVCCPVYRKMFGSYQSAGILKFRFYQHLPL